MPLDFNSTKVFRDFMISRTLQVPNGPQSFTSTNYIVQNLNDSPNVDPGEVDTNRAFDLSIPQTSNIFKPLDYFVKESFDTIPRRANLSLYYEGTPYFNAEHHSLVSIMTNSDYETESELMKFAASYIRDTNQKGPVYARIQQNLYTATVGRVRILDAIDGNTATAVNIITGREPLIEFDYSISAGHSIIGRGIDFLQTVAGVEFPWVEIPGDYLTNPSNPLNYRNYPNTFFDKVFNETTNALGSLFGIKKRYEPSKKPSDIFVDYMGSGQRQILFNLLTFSTYAPNYTTEARNVTFDPTFGRDAPVTNQYIGNDRSNDVRYAMNDFNDRPVRSNYYLSLLFDPVQTKLFEGKKNATDNGEIGGRLTWISKKSKNKIGENNEQFESQRFNFDNSLSTNHEFREDSILGVTQQILETMPTDGGAARSHIANVIDQTSRIFREGDILMSRGSAIKYVDKYGEETGVEYCRTWTKDRPYFSLSDTMKKGGNIRKFEGSIVSNPWNLNIAPMSNGQKGFEDSTNIFKGYPFGSDKDGNSFYAKKYMFSIENLAWKTSNQPGFTVLDLPYCERGPNGGRVMWFPPYDLKVNENISARWESNSFLGRPEPIYTYQNTERTGTLSFKVVVDHPSILNLLIREFFGTMSNEEADNYINAFFAGCEELDFYELIRKYVTLEPNDVELIKRYLNQGGDPEVIRKSKTVLEEVQKKDSQSISVNTTATKTPISLNTKLFFDNDIPMPDKKLESDIEYTSLYNAYIAKRSIYSSHLRTDLIVLSGYTADTNAIKDKKNIYGSPNPVDEDIDKQINLLNEYFSNLETNFNEYVSKTTQLKTDISNKIVENITINVTSSTSSIATVDHNKRLSLRRSSSLIKDFLKRISKNDQTPKLDKWITTLTKNQPTETLNINVKLKDIGWDDIDGTVTIKVKSYGETNSGTTTNSLNDDCRGRDFVKVNRLNIVSPISFYCRRSEISFNYEKSELPKPANNPNPPKELPKTKIVDDGTVVSWPKPKKPPIDVMKRIIMKVLSECYYFKKLEEDSPVVFTSLREKLRYFHPAFHSTTPEGLNSRLTFLQQCSRPGDTIPIKGLVDSTDINARNTTFGPPPVCVLRVGDFYHSKVIIRDVQINYDDTTWDFNPEGIGMQPMIASVTLQLSFIGGQGLEKPIEQLQNALSSNFYANTEMYDERSISTNTRIGGKDANTFTKQFLEQLQEITPKPLQSLDEISPNRVAQGNYIGILTNNEFDYEKVVENVFVSTRNYFKTYPIVYNNIVKTYGTILGSLILSPTYRTINNYIVNTTDVSTQTINLFGLNRKGNELFLLVEKFKTALVNKISQSNLSEIFKFHYELTTSKSNRANEILKLNVTSIIKSVLNDITTNPSLRDFESLRNELIRNLDLVNFVTKYGSDFRVENGKGTQLPLTSFSNSLFYQEYKYCVDYIQNNTSKMYSPLDGSIDFNNPTISNDNLNNILSVLLKGKEITIVDGLAGNVVNDEKTKNKLIKRLNDFTSYGTENNFSFDRFITPTKYVNVKYLVGPENEVTNGQILDDAIKLNSSKVDVTTQLNYYKI